MKKNHQNCLIIAGEKSGEDHALSFFDDLKKSSPNTHFWGVGGDSLEKNGVELISHLKDFSAWGWGLDVILKIPFFLKKEKEIASIAKERGTKAAILIDFQGFNLRLAKRLKRQGVDVLYYVAPQAWIWKAWRAEVLGQVVHTLYTLLPFEKRWFGERGVRRVAHVSHPIRVKYDQDVNKLSLAAKDAKNIKRILVLPGSRNSEVSKLLPEFTKSIKKLREITNFEVGLVRTNSVSSSCYDPYLEDFDSVYDDHQLADVLVKTDLCLAASGTVTLITAMFEVPTIVCYKVSLFSEFYLREFIKLKEYVSLINIIHKEEVFPELLQDRMNEYEILEKLKKFCLNENHYKDVALKLKGTKDLLEGELQNVGVHMAKIINEAYES